MRQEVFLIKQACRFYFYNLLFETISANIEARTEGVDQTPLHLAARHNSIESVQALIKEGANIEAKDYKNRTPIFLAAELGKIDF